MHEQDLCFLWQETASGQFSEPLKHQNQTPLQPESAACQTPVSGWHGADDFCMHPLHQKRQSAKTACCEKKLRLFSSTVADACLFLSLPVCMMGALFFCPFSGANAAFRRRFWQSYKRFSISLAMVSGEVVGSKRATTCPSRSMRNLVKFHLIESPSRYSGKFFSRASCKTLAKGCS